MAGLNLDYVASDSVDNKQDSYYTLDRMRPIDTEAYNRASESMAGFRQGSQLSEQDFDVIEDYGGTVDPYDYSGESIRLTEDQLYKDSNWAANTGRAFGNFVGKTAIQTVGNLAGAIYGAGAWAASGDFSKFYDNDFTDTLDNLEKEVSDVFRIYKPKDYDERGFFKGSGVLFADSVLDTLAFTAGMVVAGMVTGGVGALGSANKLSKLFRGVNLAKVNNTAANAAKFEKGIKAAKNIQNIEHGGRLFQQTAITGAVWEGIIETKHSMKELEESLRSRGFSEEEIEQRVSQAEVKSLVGNIAIVSASNLFQFGKVLRAPKLKSGIINEMKDVGKFIKRDGNKLAFNEGAKGIIAGRMAKGFALNPLSEFSEEASQGIISKGLISGYSTHEELENGELSFQQGLNALARGITQTMTTKEGLNEAFMGMLIGGLGSPRMVNRKSKSKQEDDVYKQRRRIGWEGTSIHNALQYRKDQAKAKEIINDINESGSRLTTYLKDRIKGMDDVASSIAMMEQAEENGDLGRAHDMHDDAILAFLRPSIKYGYTDIALAQIESLNGMSGEEFIKNTMDEASAKELLETIQMKSSSKGNTVEESNEEYNKMTEAVKSNRINSMINTAKEYSASIAKLNSIIGLNQTAKEHLAYYDYKTKYYKQANEKIWNDIKQSIEDNKSDFTESQYEELKAEYDKFVDEVNIEFEKNLGIEDRINFSMLDSEARKKFKDDILKGPFNNSESFNKIQDLLKSTNNNGILDDITDSLIESKRALSGSRKSIDLFNKVFSRRGKTEEDVARNQLEYDDSTIDNLVDGSRFEDEQSVKEYFDEIRDRVNEYSKKLKSDKDKKFASDLFSKIDKAEKRAYEKLKESKAAKEVIDEILKSKPYEPKDNSLDDNITQIDNDSDSGTGTKEASNRVIKEDKSGEEIALTLATETENSDKWERFIDNLSANNVDISTAETSVEIKASYKEQGKGGKFTGPPGGQGSFVDEKSKEVSKDKYLEQIKDGKVGFKAIISVKDSNGNTYEFETFVYNSTKVKRDQIALNNMYNQVWDSLKTNESKVTYTNVSIFESFVKKKNDPKNTSLLDRIKDIDPNDPNRDIIDNSLMYVNDAGDYSKIPKKGDEIVLDKDMAGKTAKSRAARGRMYLKTKTPSGRIIPVKLNAAKLSDVSAELPNLFGNMIYDILDGKSSDRVTVEAYKKSISDIIGLNTEHMNDSNTLLELFSTFLYNGENTLEDDNKRALALFPNKKGVSIGLDTNLLLKNGTLVDKKGKVFDKSALGEALDDAGIRVNIKISKLRASKDYGAGSYADFLLKKVISTDLEKDMHSNENGIINAGNNINARISIRQSESSTEGSDGGEVTTSNTKQTPKYKADKNHTTLSSTPNNTDNSTITTDDTVDNGYTTIDSVDDIEAKKADEIISDIFEGKMILEVTNDNIDNAIKYINSVTALVNSGSVKKSGDTFTLPLMIDGKKKFIKSTKDNIDKIIQETTCK